MPTASGDSEQYLLKFYASFAKLPATATHLPLFRLAVTDLRAYLLGQDIIYVGGGNTSADHELFEVDIWKTDPFNHWKTVD